MHCLGNERRETLGERGKNLVLLRLSSLAQRLSDLSSPLASRPAPHGEACLSPLGPARLLAGQLEVTLKGSYHSQYGNEKIKPVGSSILQNPARRDRIAVRQSAAELLCQ